MLYSDIIGQQELKQKLLKMVSDKRIPHALLFHGVEGAGQLPMAISLAAHALCKAPANGPCGNCASCQKNSKLVHPDVIFSFPIAKSKHVTCSDHLLTEFREAYLSNKYLTLEEWFEGISAENKQPIIPVDEGISIIRKLGYTSFEGSYRFVIIWMPEKMNQEAANTMLKILEEPPSQTVFVLVAVNPDALLPTILSRVQQMMFPPLNEKEIEEALVARFGVPREAAAQAAILSSGSYSEAIVFARESDVSVSFLDFFQRLMRLAFRKDFAGAVKWVEDIAGTGREKHKQFMLFGLELLRNCLMFNYGDRSLLKLAGQEKEFMEKFAPFVNEYNYGPLTELFNENHYFIERNANPKILFMDLFHRTSELINRKPTNVGA